MALKLTQFHPNRILTYSDCKSVIARINTALSAFINPLGFATAGILTTSADAQSFIVHPRQIKHVKAHPERDPARKAYPTQLDDDIFLADTIAVDSSTKLGSTRINHVAHTLILQDIINEIIPPQAWHLKNSSNMSIPVLDPPRGNISISTKQIA